MRAVRRGRRGRVALQPGKVARDPVRPGLGDQEQQKGRAALLLLEQVALDHRISPHRRRHAVRLSQSPLRVPLSRSRRVVSTPVRMQVQAMRRVGYGRAQVRQWATGRQRLSRSPPLRFAESPARAVMCIQPQYRNARRAEHPSFLTVLGLANGSQSAISNESRRRGRHGWRAGREVAE